MILNHCNFFSKTLASHVDVNVLLPSTPDNDAYKSGSLENVYSYKRYPVLYLLHGALDDYSMWIRQTNIEKYAEEAQIIVVMPSGQNMFYTNAKYGLNYFDYITKELPLFVETYFPAKNNRNSTFIAGPSMGGYGASKCALNCPEKYYAFGDLSGAVDPIKLKPLMENMGFNFFRYDLIWGGVEKQKDTNDDVYYLAEKLKDSALKPKAHIFCGIEDTNNHEMNKRFYDTLIKNGFDATFTDGSGNHDWEYWDKCIKKFIETISTYNSAYF